MRLILHHERALRPGPMARDELPLDQRKYVDKISDGLFIQHYFNPHAIQRQSPFIALITMLDQAVTEASMNPFYHQRSR